MIILYLVVTYSPQVARFSHTLLGKLFAIALIVLYSMTDIISGVLVCSLIIFYYQTDYVESFQNVLKEGFEEDLEEGLEEDLEEGLQEEYDVEEHESDDEDEDKHESKEKAKKAIKEVKKIKEKKEKETKTKKKSKEEIQEIIIEEPFELFNDAYSVSPKTPIIYDKSIQKFRQKHCSKGHLVHKGQIVKPEMAEHIFPEIEQNSFHKCNLCDPSCNFNVRKLEIEEELLEPKSSNELFEYVWGRESFNRP
jgi:hypothetical protein